MAFIPQSFLRPAVSPQHKCNQGLTITSLSISIVGIPPSSTIFSIELEWTYVSCALLAFWMWYSDDWFSLFHILNLEHIPSLWYIWTDDAFPSWKPQATTKMEYMWDTHVCHYMFCCRRKLWEGGNLCLQWRNIICKVFHMQAQYAPL